MDFKDNIPSSQAMIAEVDADGSGEIEFDEFLDLMKYWNIK